MGFISTLTHLFESNRNAENAIHMKAYMRDQFEFYGIKATQRRNLLKEAVSMHKDELKTNCRNIGKELYTSKYREHHMCAMEIIAKELRRKYDKKDIDLIEFLIVENSWWDTVDFIAKHILGQYLTIFPEEIEPVIESFSKVDNLWLNRSTILFQLGYNTRTDAKRLFDQCLRFRHSDEFFIRKAIGWALREYAKTDPQAVLNFVNSTQLKPLSHKEAVRNIK